MEVGLRRRDDRGEDARDLESRALEHRLWDVFVAERGRPRGDPFRYARFHLGHLGGESNHAAGGEERERAP